MATNKKRPAYRQVRLTIDAEQHEFAERQGQAFGYSGTADFLNGILSTAISGVMADLDDPYSREVRDLRQRAAMQEMRIQVLNDLLLQVMTSSCAMAREIREFHFGPEPAPIHSRPGGEIDDGIPI